jgi:hypothetical protein
MCGAQQKTNTQNAARRRKSGYRRLSEGMDALSPSIQIQIQG